MSTPPITAPIPTVTPAPNTRLESLVAAYAEAKPAADAAAAHLKTITDALKLELTEAAPGASKVDLTSPILPAGLRLQARTSWRLDAKRLKAEAPETYVQYAVQSTAWELRALPHQEAS